MASSRRRDAATPSTRWPRTSRQRIPAARGFGTKDKFTKYYEGPILRGREPDATDKQKKLGKARQKELSDLSDHFIIRRMNRLNAEHLPPKLTQVVCCKLTPTQQRMYEHVVRKSGRRRRYPGQRTLLELFRDYKKSATIRRSRRKSTRPLVVFRGTTLENWKEPESKNDFAASAPRPRWPHRPPLREDGRSGLPGKLRVLHVDERAAKEGPENCCSGLRVYMTTLDLIEQMCNQEDWPSCKLGGSTSTKKRKQFNDEFNDPIGLYLNYSSPPFSLSSKAGGCGLNLIGGSRLVMFDLDWNPATDKQAAARCWRATASYQCYTYRFVSSGTLEERMLQRQLSKEGLQNVIEDKDQARASASTRRHAAATPSFGTQVNSFATDDLKKLFLFRPHTASDLHDELQCPVCTGQDRRQEGSI